MDGVLRDISISITTRLQHIQWLTGPGGFFGHVSVAERQISGNLSIGPWRMCFEKWVGERVKGGIGRVAEGRIGRIGGGFLGWVCEFLRRCRFINSSGSGSSGSNAGSSNRSGIHRFCAHLIVCTLLHFNRLYAIALYILQLLLRRVLFSPNEQQHPYFGGDRILSSQREILLTGCRHIVTASIRR